MGQTITDAMVRVEDVHKSYGSGAAAVHALRGVSFEVPRGELVALKGRSGSGKTTLLNIVGGLDTPDRGRVDVEGRDLAGLDEEGLLALRRDRVGFVFQSFGLIPILSAAENVGVPLRLRGADPREREERVELLLSLVGLADHAAQRPGELSGGQQQRVAIAVALAGDPAVLLADEPTGELDSHTGEQIFAAFRTANERLGTTVVIVTHDQAVANEVSRTVAIRDGRTSTEVLRRSEVDAATGDEKVVAREYAMLDRAGRLQLPAEYTTALGMRDRVALELEPDHIAVRPDDSGREDR